MNWTKTERCRFFDRVREKVHRLHQERKLLAVKLVTKYLSKEEKQEVSLLQLLVAEGNEKADEFVNVGSMMDGGEMVEVDACSVQQRNILEEEGGRARMRGTDGRSLAGTDPNVADAPAVQHGKNASRNCSGNAGAVWSETAESLSAKEKHTKKFGQILYRIFELEMVDVPDKDGQGIVDRMRIKGRL